MKEWREAGGVEGGVLCIIAVLEVDAYGLDFEPGTGKNCVVLVWCACCDCMVPEVGVSDHHME